ncbi:MAG: hypothetical protein JWN38_446 [Candidatus Saccharibacteria bacterium]|nr:hypothetical protein [Candidatus Saccharibacteria bacterium]
MSVEKFVSNTYPFRFGDVTPESEAADNTPPVATPPRGGNMLAFSDSEPSDPTNYSETSVHYPTFSEQTVVEAVHIVSQARPSIQPFANV